MLHKPCCLKDKISKIGERHSYGVICQYIINQMRQRKNSGLLTLPMILILNQISLSIPRKDNTTILMYGRKLSCHTIIFSQDLFSAWMCRFIAPAHKRTNCYYKDQSICYIRKKLGLPKWGVPFWKETNRRGLNPLLLLFLELLQGPAVPLWS